MTNLPEPATSILIIYEHLVIICELLIETRHCAEVVLPMAFIRASSLRGYRATTLASGADPDTLLALFGLAEAERQAEQFIEVAALINLLEATSITSGNYRFGLDMARYQNPHVLGTLGHAAVHANTVGEALKLVVDYFYTHSSGTRFQLFTLQHRARLAFDTLVTHPTYPHQMTELAVASSYRLLAHEFRHRWQAYAVHLRHDSKLPPVDYQRFFNTKAVFFNSEFSGIEFHRDLLDLETQQPDADLARHLVGQLDNKPRDLLGQARANIHQLLLTQQCSIERTAGMLRLSTRNFQKKLRLLDTTYQQLLTERRCELAKDYLTRSTLTVNQVSDLLGYADAAVFSRAFKLWTGSSPSAYRRGH